MKIEELLEEIDSLLGKAWGVPFTGGKKLVDVDSLERILDDIRLHLPQEMQRANEIVSKERKIIEGARSAGETIIEKAEERAKNIINEQEIVKISRQRSKDIIVIAQQKEREIKQSAYAYVEDMMSKVEVSLIKCVGDIKDIKATVHLQKINSSKPKQVHNE